MDARIRLHGATKENACQPEHGYVLGRLWLDGRLGSGGKARMRLDAGNRYAEDMGRYYGLTGIPFPSARAQDLFRVASHAGEMDESLRQRVQRATNKFMELEGVLRSCREGVAVWTTVRNICVLDYDEARLWPQHMIDLLNIGLDALLFHYGLALEKQIR